ncbi:MAG: M20 family metallo-hydrolase [Candidatus Bathyarchaeia archaeon]
MSTADALQQVERSRDEMVQFMLDMIKIKAVNPEGGGGGEYERALFVQKWVEKLGAKVTRYDFPDNRVPEKTRVNFTTVIEGKDRSRTLWFASHLDTVPEGSRDLWSTDPYDPIVKDGKIFGRGSEDNGQAVVSTLFTLKTLKALGSVPPVNVGFAFVSDEESGSKYGVVPMVEKNVFKSKDMAIVPDTGSSDGSGIEVAEKSILWMKITTKGKQVHGSLPDKGLNAYRVGMKYALQIDELLHTKYSGVDELFDPPASTFEPTKHELNVDNINTVPGLDVQYFDCRILTRYKLKDVMKDFESVKETIEKETGARIELSLVQMEENVAPTPTNSEVVMKLSNALKKLRGIESKPIGIGGGTVGLYFRRKGVNTAIWSTLDSMAHQPNEYCKIDNMVNDAKVFVHVALN